MGRVATALGVSTGLLGHTVLAGLGLDALLSASDWLFLAVKLVGAAYLIWLGVGSVVLQADGEWAHALCGAPRSASLSRCKTLFSGSQGKVDRP